MDTELIVAVAQIDTGLATLVVALFLAGQILLQRKALDRAHTDAERDQSLSSFSLVQDHFHLRISSDALREAYDKRHEGLNKLTASDADLLRTYFSTAYARINTEFRLGRLTSHPDYYRRVYGGLMDSKAGLQYYEEHGRALVKAYDPTGERVLLTDEIYNSE